MKSLMTSSEKRKVMAAIIKREAQAMLKENPELAKEIARIYEKFGETLTYAELTEVVFGEENITNSSKEMGIIRYIIQQKVSVILRRKFHRIKNLQNLTRGAGSASKNGKVGAKVRHETGPKMNPNVLVRARGDIPYSDDEKEKLLQMKNDEDFKNAQGNRDLHKMARELNRLFHRGKEVRNRNSVNSGIRRFI